MALQKTIYLGTFIHCDSLTELDIVPNGMIGVNEEGKIAFVLRSVKGRRIPEGEGWEEARMVRIQDHGFFFSWVHRYDSRLVSGTRGKR
jgi:guanine deaminase